LAQFTTTPNIGLKKPNSGLSTGWDAYLNGNFDTLDSILGGNTAPTINCTQFAGADMSLRVQACLAALNARNSEVGVADARGFFGNQTWSINPFAGGSIPASGELLLCSQVITVNVPIVLPSAWSMTGCADRNFTSQNGTVFQASASQFQTTYSTGTVTMGTPGLSEIIAGLGTTWTSKMVGCALMSPGTEPVAANSTFGIIHSVTDSAHVVLGLGANNGTGASGGSAYKITCAVITLGDGAAQFGNGFRRLGVDCNNLAGCVGIRNWASQEGTNVREFYIRNYTNIGLDLETNGFQQSGPYEIGVISGGAAGCTTATTPIILRGGAGTPFKGIFDMTIAEGSGCGSNPAVGIDAETGQQLIRGIHFEDVTTAIDIGDTFSCPVACASINYFSGVSNVSNIEGGVAGTTIVKISNAVNVPQDDVIQNIYNGGGYTNTIVDSQNGCTDTDSRMGSYILDHTGKIASSTIRLAGCFPSFEPILASLTTTASASDNVTITGMTSSGHCQLTARNASAAANIATTYVSTLATNQITVTHTATGSMTYDIACTPN
jgi:hypothetical protein